MCSIQDLVILTVKSESQRRGKTQIRQSEINSKARIFRFPVVNSIQRLLQSSPVSRADKGYIWYFLFGKS